MYRAAIARIAVTAVVLTTASARSVAAQGRSSSPPERPRPAAVLATPLRITTGTVVGTAWRGDTTPYAQARIRLRDVSTGRGVARAVADGEGFFRFAEVGPGAYVVELLSTDDRVLAVGELFGITPGAEVKTFVRLSAKAPWFGGFFGNAAAAVIAAASTLGVTATGSNGQPVSPQ
jgi:hypothetical protein